MKFKFFISALTILLSAVFCFPLYFAWPRTVTPCFSVNIVWLTGESQEESPNNIEVNFFMGLWNSSLPLVRAGNQVLGLKTNGKIVLHVGGELLSATDFS